MIDKLNDLFDNISIEDLEQLDCPMPKIKINRKSKKKILSLTQRKVDNKVRKISFKRPVAILLASIITVVGTVTAGATAYKYFKNQDSIENYLGKESVEKLGELNLVENKTQESEHFRITADTVINDGYTFNTIFTCEALDDFGEQYLKEQGFVVIWSDEAEGPGGILNEEGLKNDRKHSEILSFFLSNVDKNKDKITFTPSIRTAKKSKSGKCILNYEELKDKNGNNIKFTFDLTPNYKAIEMVSDDNKKIYCNPVGVSSFDEEITSCQDCTTIKFSNGTEKTLNYNDRSFDTCEFNGTDNFKSFMGFGDFIDLKDCISIEILGTEYKRK